MKKNDMAYAVTCPYFPDNDHLFGVYSSVENAQQAIETFLDNEYSIDEWEKLSEHVYWFKTEDSEKWVVEIHTNRIDDDVRN